MCSSVPGWLLVACMCSMSLAFCPPSSRLSLRKASPVSQWQSSLYFFGRNKDDEKKQDEQREDKEFGETRRIPFFSRLLEREAKSVEEETTKTAEESPTSTAVVTKEETKPGEKSPPAVDPATEKEEEEETYLSRAKRLKAQAERIRLEAERMDAQLTLDKIERLERELVHARKKGEGVEELQKEMENLQAKMRGEAPKPRIAAPKQSSSSISKTVSLQSTAKEPSQPVDEERLKEYLEVWERTPKFMKNKVAGMVGLYGDVEDLNATEVALRMEMKDRSDYSFIQGSKPEFSKEDLDEVKKNPYFKLKVTTETASEDELATKLLEDEYYTDLLSKQYNEAIVNDGDTLFEIEIRNMTELDTITESLFPAATRKDGQAPTFAQAMTLITDVLPKAGFNPSGKPEKVPGGFIIRGTNKLNDNNMLIEAIDALLAKSPLENKLSVFYIKDYTIFTEDQMESLDFSPVDAVPILLVTGPNVAREPRRLLFSAVSAFGIASSWYLSIYPFLLNPDLMKRAEEQMQLADANMAYDLTWLTELSLPLFATFMGIQLAHEVGHRAVAAVYDMNVTVPVFVPSIVTGMTSVVTTFKSPPKNKQAMFDFAVAGPLTGIAASIVGMYLGLEFTVFSSAEAYAQFPALPLEILRQSTLGGGLIEFILGTGALAVPGGAEGTSAIASINIPLHPVAIAGYIGLIVNALALLPIGTTDGGRISMTLFSRGAKIVVGQLFLFLLLATGLVGSDLFLLYFSFLVFFQRGNEIPARNEVDDISFSRVLLATFAGVITLLTLIPIS